MRWIDDLERRVLIPRSMATPKLTSLDITVLLFARSRRRGGGGGAPAELGLPQVPSAATTPIAARPASTQYAEA